MSSSYGSFPVKNSAVPAPEETSSPSKSTFFAKVAGVVVVAFLVVSKISGGNQADTTASMVNGSWFLGDLKSDILASSDRGEMWPEDLITAASNQPTTTEEALESGWTKVINGGCNPKLGMPYRRNNGQRSIKDPVTLYFTPDAKGVPGIISGIEVDYYGYVEENLIGDYFRDGQTNEDGKVFHTLALALRNYDDYYLCDTHSPIEYIGLEKITLAPDGAALNIPLKESDEELKAGWEQGSCIITMGTHWAKDVVGGSRLTYETKNLVPILPMYNTHTGDIQAFLFAATDLKQTFPMRCFPPNLMNPIETWECADGEVNGWDLSPGLTQANKPGMYMCSNFCRADCAFTGSPDEMFTTMHFMFNNIGASSPNMEQCKGGGHTERTGRGSYCRPDAGPGQGVPYPGMMV